LSIDKKSFNRHIIPIIIYSVTGTIVATVLTAGIVHYGTTLIPWCLGIPFVEALTFGALISSIDPIAVLSVLSNMGMTDNDTIYVLIFGESLLNDGVAIVLFHTLVHFLDENLIIDQAAINAAAIHFAVVAIGSLLVGVAAGIVSTVFFWIFHGCQTPLVEVIMFFCWALLPYYICDGIGWSGIVAAVAVGFFMDVYIVGQHTWKHGHHSNTSPKIVDDSLVNDDTERSHASNGSHVVETKKSDRSRRRIFSQKGHLSAEARTHIGFVTEIISTSMETAIFAYLGFFLFSHRYHWNFFHILIAIIACCTSRAIMIPSLGVISNWITRIQQNRHRISIACSMSSDKKSTGKPDGSVGVFIDRKMQIALWFAGLRGAMSFALVEHIPLYDEYSGRGTRLKPELKAMTSASIMFTVFVLGGYTYYVIRNLGISPQANKPTTIASHEVGSLLGTRDKENIDDDDDFDGIDLFNYSTYDKSLPTEKEVSRVLRRQRCAAPSRQKYSPIQGND
jgi:NhaP-type Na+/H+ or K+/H+ antiporter